MTLSSILVLVVFVYFSVWICTRTPACPGAQMEEWRWDDPKFRDSLCYVLGQPGLHETLSQTKQDETTKVTVEKKKSLALATILVPETEFPPPCCPTPSFALT